MEVAENPICNRVGIKFLKNIVMSNIEFTLQYNAFKGTGKCWVAIVNPKNKKIESFINATNTEKFDKYKGQKYFELPADDEETLYLFCETDTKSSDKKRYYKVKDGKLERQ